MKRYFVASGDKDRYDSKVRMHIGHSRVFRSLDQAAECMIVECHSMFPHLSGGVVSMYTETEYVLVLETYDGGKVRRVTKERVRKALLRAVENPKTVDKMLEGFRKHMNICKKKVG